KDATNEYKILSLAYNEAALKAKNYTLTLGANHPITIGAVTDAKRLGDQLKGIDASVGQNQRNVGNYPQSLMKIAAGFKSVFSVVRQGANILPGVGISGIFLALFTGVKELVSILGGASAAAEKLDEDLTRLGAAGEKARNSL